jgi:putative aldouronate transport system substrate-binding protein
MPVNGYDNFNVMLTSGDLPDVLFVWERQLDTLEKAGLLLNWDDYKDKLPNIYAPHMENAIRFNRDMNSNGTGNLYALSTGITNDTLKTGNDNYGPYLRWDLYKELGMPVLNEFEDYLPLLKRMQDAHPVNEAGQRVYGISLFSSWGSLPNYFSLYYGSGMIGTFLEIDLVKNTTRSILDNDSYYKRGLQFYFTANQMGIVDPDSLSQSYEDMLVKGKAGRVLFSWWPWGLRASSEPPNGTRRGSDTSWFPSRTNGCTPVR